MQSDQMLRRVLIRPFSRYQFRPSAVSSSWVRLRTNTTGFTAMVSVTCIIYHYDYSRLLSLSVLPPLRVATSSAGPIALNRTFPLTNACSPRVDK